MDMAKSAALLIAAAILAILITLAVTAITKLISVEMGYDVVVTEQMVINAAPFLFALFFAAFVLGFIVVIARKQ